MKYAEFKKIRNLDQLLLLRLGALGYSSHLFEIDNYPDFDLSEYNKHAEQTYFFSADLPFPDEFATVIRIDEIKVRLFTYDDLERLSKERHIDIPKRDRYVEFLQNIYETEESLPDEGNVPNFDGFLLHSVKIAGINNTTKAISILGGYRADPAWIQPYDCYFILFCNVLGIPSASIRHKLHLGLIAEGYSLIASGNYSLSFFMIYTAIECYLNTELEAHEDQCRLSEKMQELFKRIFSPEDLGKHQIYTSIIKEFTGYTSTRNEIAHGTNAIQLTESDARGILLFSLLLIASLECRTSTFQELKDAIHA